LDLLRAKALRAAPLSEPLCPLSTSYDKFAKNAYNRHQVCL